MMKSADMAEQKFSAQSNIKQDSILIADTLKIQKVLQFIQFDENFMSLIEYPDNDKNKFVYLLSKLKSAHKQSTHILYYGDSQIEEDRFSAVLRQGLQSIYGGSGCGLLSMMPVAPWIYPKISYSDNWYKWDCYADVPKKDEYYGITAQTFLINFNDKPSSWSLKCNADMSSSVCLFNKIVMYYGYAKEPIKIKYLNGSEIISEHTLNNPDFFDKKIFAVKNNESIQFEFEGFESPYFYGISLESFDNGVYVDNIALRGSSGTFFHLINRELLKKFFEDLNVSLIILQFGGNIMPMIDSEEKARQYANYIDYQLKIIKSIHSQLPILFIGPADMSVNIDGVMQTHPYLETMIHYLKKTVLNNGYAFFDMYKAMGGKNSMPVWVEENLAAKDYLHFSPAGARKMASLIYYSILQDLKELKTIY
ncbi:MAG: hypothetical protein N2203_02370 [Bacteroidia bacterium]|nr:hypothetical protein [Bacteroidia bacterium]